MHFTKKFDRAFQWAGEKMGSEAKTSMSDDFKDLEVEIGLRHDGMDRLQKSMNAFIKWLGRRGETFEDKEKGLPASYLGRTMVSHGEDFESDSEFGNCLIAMGRANERVAGLQEHFVADATSTWLESLERSLTMMKEYQSARKRLENRRLAYDASISKMHKVKKDDFRIEEELRNNKVKYEESSEDVMRRMQDIKETEGDTVRDLTHFLDAELEYHERCAEELRRVRETWPADTGSSNGSNGYHSGAGSHTPVRRPTNRSRSNTTQSYTGRISRTGSGDSIYETEEPEPIRPPMRSQTSRPGIASYAAEPRARPPISTSQTFHSGESTGPDRPARRVSGSATPNASNYASQSSLNVGALRAQLRPTSRTTSSSFAQNDVFGDRDDDTASSNSSPSWGERSASPATSLDSLTRSTPSVGAGGGNGGSGYGQRKAPPPPPPSRAKKPPPPIPMKREVGY